MKASVNAATSDVLQAAFKEAAGYGEQGIQVAAFLGTDLIVDAVYGTADSSRRPVSADTLFPVFSFSKAIAATALHLQAERGLVDYDAPVAVYWPEFAANGKGDITVRHVLSHQSGIAQMPEGVTPDLLADWEWMTTQIAAFHPYFPAGTSSAYQSLVFGWIVGEVVRRTDPSQRTFDAFVRDELTGPLGVADDLWFGVPDDVLPRVAELSSSMSRERMPGETPLSLAAKPDAVAPDAHVHNLRVVQQAVYPGAGAIMTARAGATVLAMLGNGGEFGGTRFLSPERIRGFLTPRPNGSELDQVLFGGNRVPAPVGVGGYWLGAGTVLGGGNSILRHGGSGGSLGWVDLDRRLAVVIAHNRLFEGYDPTSQDHPFAAIGRAVLAEAARRENASA
jgi:CubicO group peptidase (beta-lactamase class C family)